jgi:hypothetical protein
MSNVFAFEPFDDRRILMLHGEVGPSSSEWNEYLKLLRTMDVERAGLLVFSDGGAPDAAQRRGLNDLLAGRRFARAIVNDSTFVRGVISAVGWFAPGVKAFSPGDWKAAAEHARFESHELGVLARRLGVLARALHPGVPWLSAALEGS